MTGLEDPYRNRGFGGLPEDGERYETAASVVLPVPYERTTSWHTGTYLGPHAAILASRQLELYDEELRCEPAATGIATLAPPRHLTAEPSLALRAIREAAQDVLGDGKFLVALGGEHTISLPLVEATRAVHGEVGVLHFDAHADLRDRYEGTRYSHACVMRRIRELGCPTLSVGIRSLSAEEAAWADSERVPILWAHQAPSVADLGRAIAALPAKIYLTFDVDYFDPALVPATGTPEPGGGGWHATLDLLREAFRTREVVAVDLVELAPTPGHHASDFLVAKLAYKCIGYRHHEI